MTSQQFFQTYAQYEPDIIKILTGKNIFDEDLLHDTMLALYEHSPHPAPDEFVTTFVSFYTNARDWQAQQASHFIPHDNVHLAALDIPDESVGEDAIDQHLDHTNRATYRERCRALLPKVIDYYFSHPQPGERNRRRACRILRLYLQGLSECQIARELKLSQPTIHQYFTRIIGHLKAIALVLYNRGA